MPSHQLRFIGICVLAGIAAIGMIVFGAMGITEGTAFGAVAGILAVCIPALIDAGAVEARRRDPNVAAMVDDVRGDGEWIAGKRQHDPHDPTTPPAPVVSEEITKPGVE